ncbi:MAG TPA: SRPBCC family protein [Polyangiales bacterium]|nr:SRPBCC family protein [Polyangiales bacterium]
MSTRQKLPLADDVEIARRVLAHIDAGTTDEGEVWREPVQNYLDPARFAAELRVLRAVASVFGPSAALPDVGDHIERPVFGVPLFAVRDREHRVRVFRNACRHRGAKLVQGSGCSRAFVCSYHGWTYALDGALAHVPHPEGFPGLDTASRGLVEVPSREVDGLIVLDPLEPTAHAEPALHDGSPWRDKLANLKHVGGVNTSVQPINWKVLVEQFLEGYHIRATHSKTFYPLQYDNLNVIEFFGPNSRITYPYRNIERLRDRPESTWVLGHRLTFLYHLFPNVMIATFPEVTLVVVIDPIDVAQTTLTTYSLAQLAPATDTHPADAGRSLVEQGAREDNAMSMAVQRGLASGANTWLEFGRYESAIGHFHRQLAALLSR